MCGDFFKALQVVPMTVLVCLPESVFVSFLSPCLYLPYPLKSEELSTNSW